MGGKNKTKLVLFIVIFLVTISFSYAATELLSVGAASAGNAADWNTDEGTPGTPYASTLIVGGTATDSLTMNNPSFSVSDTINSISVILFHGGAAGIKGDTNLVFKSSGGTTYCTNTIANTATFRYDTVTPTGCAWTYARLQDLVIDVSTTDSKKDAYYDFINYTVNYTPYSDSTPPSVTLGNPVNDTWETINPITFYYTPDDTESPIYNCSLMINGSVNKTQTGGITKGVQNTFSQNLADGVWSWTVKCADTWNNSYTATPTKIIKVDTKGPVVKLESPANNTNWVISQNVDFKFNATDATRSLQLCELIIDDVTRDTKITPSESVSLTFSYSPGNGQHYWSINCTDTNSPGFETASPIYNLTVTYFGRTLLTDAGTYEQGSPVSISGNNWLGLSIVTLMLDLPNGTTQMWNTTANAGGEITDFYYINYSHPTGDYNITAYEYLTPSNNASNMFTVLPRVANLIIGNSFKQGEIVEINGTGFSPNGLVNLNITSGTGSNITNQTTDNNGDFNFNFETNYSSWIGLYDVIAFDTSYLNLNDTSNFTLNSRTPSLSTDKYNYAGNEKVNIFGYNFSILGLININIFENLTGSIAPMYPAQINANYSGNFYDFWNTTDTCPGIYGINAYDNNYTLYNETIYINLTGSTQNYNYTPISTSGGTPGLASSLQTKDDSNAESLTLTLVTQYIYFTFNNTIPADSGVNNAIVRVNHQESDPSSKLNTIDLQILSGTWTTACTLLKSGSYLYENCDLSAYITNGSLANDVQLRIAYTRSNGGTAPVAYIDYGLMEVTATGTGACTSWSNQPPSIISIEVDDFYTGIGNQIDLLAGTLTPVYCNVTAYDYGGSNTILNTSGTFYYYLNNSLDPDDNNVHYTDSNCTLISEDVVGKTKDFTCNFNVSYHANNGTWYCNATTYDTDLTYTSALDASSINSLYALNITSNITFAEIETGVVSNEVTSTIINIGNIEIDLGVDGYAVNDGDGIAMNCTEGNISFNDFRYDLVALQPFTSMTPITDSVATLTGFNLIKQITSSSTRNIYWKVRPTPLSRGNCQGIVVYTAMASI